MLIEPLGWKNTNHVRIYNKFKNNKLRYILTHYKWGAREFPRLNVTKTYYEDELEKCIKDAMCLQALYI